MAPKAAEEFIAAYHEQVNRERREATAARAGKERELGEVTRKLDKLIDALMEGYRAPGLQQRLDELEARKAALEQELAADPPPPVRLHPNLAQTYREKIERLHEVLHDPEIRDEAMEIIRSLVERVVIHATEDGPWLSWWATSCGWWSWGWTPKRPRSRGRRPVRSRWSRGLDLDFVHSSWRRRSRA